ncbi:hypothetical protein GGS23DRAFT_166100 [Durotheca rogersii]|uniref:uncharacterized protein n=1 Tax=Durotheca rogersii TaxID=419775 RepID=UPI00221EB650|nr:uncharacterized protein GGS23DRAFT_166100 [Durotheca rogersii]KAI5867207.1 hypothetical protein GGS23DRAFT_166100 [Durotheca rogersii]
MATKAVTTAFLLLGAIQDVAAFWRMECRGRTGLARMDPIMDPGVVSPHIHAVHGSSGFALDATYNDLVAGSCTSCAVKQDKSAYWTPALYFQDAETQEFEVVPQVGGMLAYYLLRGPNVTAFPPNFHMVAGSNYRRDYTVGDPKAPDPPQSSWVALKQTSQEDLEQRALGFNCMNYQKTPEGSLDRHYLPDKDFLDANCIDGLRLEVMFPSCWNGEVAAQDHKSHVAYPDLVGNGVCPDTHTSRLPTLFYEIIWDTHANQFQGRKGQFVISNGDPTGFGYHGDFMNGWDPAFLQKAIDVCTNDSGDIRDCPVFVENGPLQTDEEQHACEFALPEALAGEDGAVPNLKSLPGNLAIQSGPQSATRGSADATPIASVVNSVISDVLGAGGTTTTALSTTSSSLVTSSSAIATSSAPGGAFIESSPTPAVSSQDFNALTSPLQPTPPEPTPSSESSSSEPAPPTTTSAPVFTSEPGVEYRVVSTQTITHGPLIEEIVWMEPVVYVTEDSVTTVTVNPPAVRSARKIQGRHALQHRHHGHH